MAERWRSFGSIALALLGVGAIGTMPHHIGVDPIEQAFERVGVALLALVLLELGVLAADARAAGIVLGAAPSVALVRGAIAAFVAAALLPAGRMAGELVRASHFDGKVPRGRAAMGVLMIHGLHVAVGACSALVLGLALHEQHPALSAATLACAAWAGLVASILLAATRSVPVAQWLLRRLGLTHDLECARIDGRAVVHAGAWAVLARLLHLSQAIALARAVLGPDTAVDAGLAIEALQHIAGSVGDAVPGQVGVLEGTFGAFGTALLPHAEAARAAEIAVASALVLRTVRLGLGAVLGVAHVTLAPRILSPRARPA